MVAVSLKGKARAAKETSDQATALYEQGQQAFTAKQSNRAVELYEEGLSVANTDALTAQITKAMKGVKDAAVAAAELKLTSGQAALKAHEYSTAIGAYHSGLAVEALSDEWKAKLTSASDEARAAKQLHESALLGYAEG
eukprot:COSAG01_NODE_32125_length_586_cov_0.677618_1_plen_139_part_00